MTDIAKRLADVQKRIRSAELAANRVAGEVRLLAVSKTHDATKIRAAWMAGQRLFGENYLQEALFKKTALRDVEIEWHFIGRLQSNKTREIAENFAWVHSLSNISHALRLSAQRPLSLPPLNVCIQVNLSGELSKSGVAPDAVLPLLTCCLDSQHLLLRGLMAIPEPVNDPMLQRAQFERLRRLRDALNKENMPLDTLSMGMSEDLEAAIAAGATLVRIGTAIFGTRNYNAN